MFTHFLNQTIFLDLAEDTLTANLLAEIGMVD